MVLASKLRQVAMSTYRSSVRPTPAGIQERANRSQDTHSGGFCNSTVALKSDLSRAQEVAAHKPPRSLTPTPVDTAPSQVATALLIVIDRHLMYSATSFSLLANNIATTTTNLRAAPAQEGGAHRRPLPGLPAQSPQTKSLQCVYEPVLALSL